MNRISLEKKWDFQIADADNPLDFLLALISAPDGDLGTAVATDVCSQKRWTCHLKILYPGVPTKLKPRFGLAVHKIRPGAECRDTALLVLFHSAASAITIRLTSGRLSSINNRQSSVC